MGPSLAGHKEETIPFAPILMKAAGSPTVHARSGYYATPDQGVRPAKSAAVR